MAVTTDGGQTESTFDPDAPCTARVGLSYKCFADRIRARPDPEDPANAQIERLTKAGRSEAFCREYRIGYGRTTRAFGSVADTAGGTDHESQRRWVDTFGPYVAHRAGLVYAEYACPEDAKAARARPNPFRPAAAPAGFGLRFTPI